MWTCKCLNKLTTNSAATCRIAQSGFFLQEWASRGTTHCFLGHTVSESSQRAAEHQRATGRAPRWSLRANISNGNLLCWATWRVTHLKDLCTVGGWGDLYHSLRHQCLHSRRIAAELLSIVLLLFCNCTELWSNCLHRLTLPHSFSCSFVASVSSDRFAVRYWIGLISSSASRLFSHRFRTGTWDMRSYQLWDRVKCNLDWGAPQITALALRKTANQFEKCINIELLTYLETLFYFSVKQC